MTLSNKNYGRSYSLIHDLSTISFNEISINTRSLCTYIFEKIIEDHKKVEFGYDFSCLVQQINISKLLPTSVPQICFMVWKTARCNRLRENISALPVFGLIYHSNMALLLVCSNICRNSIFFLLHNFFDKINASVSSDLVTTV